MSFAIYGESNGYVHLIAAETKDKAIELFKQDVNEVGVRLSTIVNVFAVENNREDKDLEDLIEKMIKDSKQTV